MDRTWTRLGRLLLDGARAVAAGTRTQDAPPRTGRPRRRPAGGAPRAGAPRAGAPSAGAPGAGQVPGTYPGDFTGTARVEYAPRADDRADPGEVVWAWVPYEEDHARGKDRPALVVGRDGRWVLALMLTSRDHDGDPHRSTGGADWMDVGAGSWDSRGRPSEVRLDRVLRLDPDGIRREGARLDRDRFDQVAGALRRRHGWT